jgi:hypothetical protein
MRSPEIPARTFPRGGCRSVVTTGPDSVDFDSEAALLGLEPALGAVDPTLLALPAPPSTQRMVAMTLLAVAIGMASGLLASLRPDVSYFFAPDVAESMGEAAQLAPVKLTPNRYVSIDGNPMLSGMVRFERALTGTEYVVFPLAGQRNVFVQVPAGDLSDPRTAARRTFSGRLVTFDQLGSRFNAVQRYLSEHMQMPVSDQSFLLIVDEPPSRALWALGLSAMCAAMIAASAWLMLCWFRPLR